MDSVGVALRQIFSPRGVRRSLLVALVDGTALNAMNQRPEFWHGQPVNVWKLLLTYVVPFWSYGTYAGLRAR